MRLRDAMLLTAAVLIAAACVYKFTRTYDASADVERPSVCPVPGADVLLPSQHRPPRTVKLEAFLTRHPIIVVFYDGKRGAEADPVLLRLRREFETLDGANVKIVGVSTAIPQENRPPLAGRPRRGAQPREEFPFPLLTDLPPACRFHKIWGRFDDSRNRPLSGVFFIDRTGFVACDEHGRPKPLDDPNAAIDELTR